MSVGADLIQLLKSMQNEIADQGREVVEIIVTPSTLEAWSNAMNEYYAETKNDYRIGIVTSVFGIPVRADANPIQFVTRRKE